MTTETQRRIVGVDEWLDYNRPEGRRVELVDGEIVIMPAPNMPHQRFLNNLHRIFIPYQEAHPDRIVLIASPGAVPIPGRDEGCEPDVALYDRVPEDQSSSKAWKEVRPFLVVEVVSPDYRKRDYIDKWRAYHDAEIPEYWIVDGDRRHFLALRWRPGDWEIHRIEEAGAYSTPLLPGLELNVARLWP